MHVNLRQKSEGPPRLKLLIQSLIPRGTGENIERADRQFLVKDATFVGGLGCPEEPGNRRFSMSTWCLSTRVQM